MMDSMPVNSTVLAKKELIYAGPFGLCAWLSGLVFVNRSNRSSAVETMKRVAKIMHERQVSKHFFIFQLFCIITFFFIKHEL